MPGYLHSGFGPASGKEPLCRGVPVRIRTLKEVETMLESDKYAYVNIGGGVESVYIRIKKDTPVPEQDKAKLTAWADKNGFTVSAKKRILRAE
jgi:hypothetical protein